MNECEDCYSHACTRDIQELRKEIEALQVRIEKLEKLLEKSK